MKPLFVFSIIYIICFIATFLFISIKNISVRDKNLKISLIILIFSLVILSMCIKPSDVYDLYRHYEVIEQFKLSGYWTETVYDNFIIIRLIFYIISLFNYNELLPAISCIITYGIFVHIIIDFKTRNSLGIRQIAISILLNLTMIPFVVVYSGVRNTMVFSILALAIYREFVEKKRNVLTYLIYLLPIFIHYATIIIIGLRILYIFVDKIFKYRYILLVWSLSASLISKILLIIPNSYIKGMGAQIGNYIGDFLGDTRIFIVNFVLVLVFLIIFEIIIRKEEYKNTKLKEILRFIDMVLIIAVGGFFVPNILDRLLLFIGMFTPIICYVIFNLLKNRKFKTFIFSFLAIYIIGCAAYQYVGIVNNGLKVSFEPIKIEMKKEIAPMNGIGWGREEAY